MLVTPASLEAAYSFLLTTRPFSAWKLPHVDEVEFHVLRTHKLHGDYSYPPHTIRATQHWKDLHTETFLITVAHEMVHMRCALAGFPVDHGKEFKRLARMVCREHGWCVATF